MAMANYNQFFKAARAVKQDETPEPGPNRPRKKRSKPKVKFPFFAVVALAVSLVAAVWALMNVEQIENFVSTVDVRFLGAANAEPASAKTTPTKGDKAEKAASGESHKPETTGGASKTWTAEQVSIFNKLEDRRKALDSKEQELVKLEEELQKQRVELDERVQELEKLRTKIADRLTERVGVDQQRVDKLVEIYSNMKPQNAAKLFEEIDEDLAVEVLGKMKKKNMADILNLLKSDKAQRLSERFAGYKRQ
jgi:flagellar motility protein MotE (MotC chaperone)